MANKIYNVGNNQTNLLSNDNLVVYSDISMKSKFNSAATSREFYIKPNEINYLKDLELENYIYSSTSNGSVELTADSKISNYVISNLDKLNNTLNNVSILTDRDLSHDLDTVKIFPDKSYIDDYNSFIINTSMSKYKVDRSVNVRAVQNSLHNIFSWLPGERILNPEFGNTLYKYLYSGITDYNTEQIIAEIQHCISEYEPRVSINQIVNVSTVEDTENNTIHLEIIYSIPTLNEQQYSYMYTYTKQSE